MNVCVLSALKTKANYASIERIQSELEYAKAIMRRLHCQVLDVSNEIYRKTASLVMQLIDKTVHRRVNEYTGTSRGEGGFTPFSLCC